MRFGCESRKKDCVAAWTAGARVCNQDARFKRAGCGVFLSTGDAWNRSFTLPGREQTNNRADLLAAIATMRAHEKNLEIRSYTEYVVRAATEIL